VENPLTDLSEQPLETVPSAKCAVHVSRDWQAFAKAKLDSLTKPPGSLGRLEEIAAKIVSIREQESPGCSNKAVYVFAADHGVTEQGVSAYPKAVTQQMVRNFLANGAAINVLARCARVEVIVVDVGVDGAVVTPAFVPVARNAGLNVIFDLSTIKTRFANIGLMAQERLIREQPRLVKGAVAGLVHGIKYWKTNPDAAKAHLKQIHKVSAADLDSIYEDASKNVRSEPTPDLDGIQTAWENVPELKARGPVDFRKFVEPRFIEEVLREMK